MKSEIWTFFDLLESKGTISEVMINSSSRVFIERNSQMIALDMSFDLKEIDLFCQEVASFNNQDFNQMNPILNGVLPSGSRVNLIHKSYTQGCSIITIRNHLSIAHNLEQAASKFSYNQKWASFFRSLVASRMNVLISGGTATGKTTFLSTMLKEMPKDNRIIAIEDTRELFITHRNFISLESKSFLPDGLKVRDLLKNALRMRPDKIVIGEVRAEEAFDLLQALNTGHEGSMCTIHANSDREALSRVENLFLMAGYDLPIRVVRQQIVQAFDFIIQLGRNRDNNRVIKSVTEVGNMEGEMILLNKIGEHTDGKLAFSGLTPQRMKKLMSVGVPANFFDN